ncbi:MAG: precorrin-6y C5,15-methyltransferase (decarboxylating) subunit CbiE [Alphaproteobacteria bacterium]|nr:precorrin-6y C5,15-methyltransferase (decarboxylating) subunit CbiE [Alphaproteobacteria bacterium]
MNETTTPWLSIVGLGEDGLSGLSPLAHALVNRAEILIGGTRHLAMIPADSRQRLTWTRPLSKLFERVDTLRGRPVCVLATGDPMAFGVGVSLARRIPVNEMIIVPGVSAFSLACARMGWPIAEAETLTIHGRPVELINAVLYPGARIIALSADGKTPAMIAKLLCMQGYGESRMTVLEHMDGVNERRIDATAATFGADATADLNTLAVQCVAASGIKAIARVPGIPDDVFRHDGQLTKREVRATTLAALSPLPAQLLWDIGAGCGSIAIEWMRSARSTRAIAIERDPARVANIAFNAGNLGVPNLKIVTGEAPAAVAGLERPNAIFLGGGIATPGLLERCWAELGSRGRLVANAVTTEGEAVLIAARQRWGGELVRIAITRAEPMGAFSGWRALAPVTQFAITKA